MKCGPIYLWSQIILAENIISNLFALPIADKIEILKITCFTSRKLTNVSFALTFSSYNFIQFYGTFFPTLHVVDDKIDSTKASHDVTKTLL